ncbi:hypothetical protein QMZ05_24610 [Bradyrhizobium sp. INPA03-11B]|uniref:hypothetical protein n=1 Tax=Bradyrhizobium sp. INPA03-11B TaxID=418598 RepID=UPI00338E0765
MSLTFKSSRPESFRLVGTDANGRTRVATAQKQSGDFYWSLRLEHPSGRNWQAQYHGQAVLDALGELMRSKDNEYVQDRARGDRPHTDAADLNYAVNDVDPDGAPISSIFQRR